MPVVGHGLVARYIRQIAAGHPTVVFFASGVPGTNQAATKAVAREEQLLRRTLVACERLEQTLVYFSSIGALGPDDGSLRNEADEIRPVTAYGAHKAAMEDLVRRSAVQYVIFRLAHLVGAGQNPAQLVPALATQILRGEVVLAPNALRDVLDVADAVGLIDRVLTSCATDGVEVNIASGHAVSVGDLAEALSDRLGRTPVIRGSSMARTGYIADVQRLSSYVGAAALSEFEPMYYRRVLGRYYRNTTAGAPEVSSLKAQ